MSVCVNNSPVPLYLCPSFSERVSLTYHMKRREAECCHVLSKFSKLDDADMTSPANEWDPLMVAQGQFAHKERINKIMHASETKSPIRRLICSFSSWRPTSTFPSWHLMSECFLNDSLFQSVNWLLCFLRCWVSFHCEQKKRSVCKNALIVFVLCLICWIHLRHKQKEGA